MENLNETISEECDSENESHFETPNNNFESENESHFETPNNSWVYEGESIPIHCDRFLIDFNGFKSKEPSNVDKYINKYRKMAQEVNQDLLLELKNPYDSDRGIYLTVQIPLRYNYDTVQKKSTDNGTQIN